MRGAESRVQYPQQTPLQMQNRGALLSPDPPAHTAMFTPNQMDARYADRHHFEQVAPVPYSEHKAGFPKPPKYNVDRLNLSSHDAFAGSDIFNMSALNESLHLGQDYTIPSSQMPKQVEVLASGQEPGPTKPRKPTQRVFSECGEQPPVEGVVLAGPHRDIKSSSRLPQAFRIYRTNQFKLSRKGPTQPDKPQLAKARRE